MQRPRFAPTLITNIAERAVGISEETVDGSAVDHFPAIPRPDGKV
jgi:hypothetical protein